MASTKQYFLISIVILVALGGGYYYLKETSDYVERFYCSHESRLVDFCLERESPVCGWYDQSIRCFAYPCAEDFSNECFACMNENVEYYTQGECPDPGS